MSDYLERLRNFNRAGQLQYEWFDEVAEHIEGLETKLKEASPQSSTTFSCVRCGKVGCVVG